MGDNGSSAEGGPEGTYNEMMALNGIVGKSDQMMGHLESWGSPTTYPHFAIRSQFHHVVDIAPPCSTRPRLVQGKKFSYPLSRESRR